MIKAPALIAGAASKVAAWLAHDRTSPGTVSDAARTLSKRAHDARRAARSKRVWAHVAALQADIARNLPQRPEQAGE
jgi:hypothetical protein